MVWLYLRSHWLSGWATAHSAQGKRISCLSISCCRCLHWARHMMETKYFGRNTLVVSRGKKKTLRFQSTDHQWWLFPHSPFVTAGDWAQCLEHARRIVTTEVCLPPSDSSLKFLKLYYADTWELIQNTMQVGYSLLLSHTFHLCLLLWECGNNWSSE